jgi:hypothetical protein
MKTLGDRSWVRKQAKAKKVMTQNTLPMPVMPENALLIPGSVVEFAS